MPVLKDMWCAECGNNSEHVVEQDTAEMAEECPHCLKHTSLVSRCTGGAKLKTYLVSFDGRNFSGDVKFLGVRGENADGSTYTEGDGSPTHNKFNRDFDARLQDKRDRRNSARKRLLSSQPIFIDHGATSSR